MVKPPRPEQHQTLAQMRVKASRTMHAKAGRAFRAVVRVAMKAGAPSATAYVLAAEAVDRALEESEGDVMTKEAEERAQERVIKAAERMVQVMNAQNGKETRSTGLDKERQRALGDEVSSMELGMRAINEVVGEEMAPVPAGGGKSINVEAKKKDKELVFPSPPLACPSRLMDLVGDAVEAVRASGSRSPAARWSKRGFSRRGHNSEPVKPAGLPGYRSKGASSPSRAPPPLRRWPAVPFWLAPPQGDHDTLARTTLAKRVMEVGFQAIAAYRAHDVGWRGRAGRRGDGDGDGEGRTRGKDGFTEEVSSLAFASPLYVTGFTWDGVTVVMKENAVGCVRSAQPGVPISLANATVTRGSWDGASAVGTPRKGGGEGSGDEGDGVGCDQLGGDAGGTTQRHPGCPEDGDTLSTGGAPDGELTCLSVETMFVPSSETVVDIIVPVRNKDGTFHTWHKYLFLNKSTSIMSN